MNLKEEILHHIFPGVSSTGVMLFSENLLFSVSTGVIIYIITHAISFVSKTILKKFKCGKID